VAQRYYKLDLVARALRTWQPLTAIRLSWQVLRTQLFYERKYVYGLTPSELHRVPVLDIPGYHIECLSTVPELQHFEQELCECPGLLPDDVMRLHTFGALFWVGRVNGRLASLGVSRRGAPTRDYFWPLVPSCVMLSHFGTVPEFRGRGLYPAMLTHILRELAPDHVEYFLIECGDWNIGSRRGIEHAGFRHIGYGKATVRGRLSWYPLPPEVPGPVMTLPRRQTPRARRLRQPVQPGPGSSSI
jgi:GNAT superfamily N-acetyltransferase